MYRPINEFTEFNKIDIKQTLKELHQKFPDLTIEELFDILDCIKYEYSFTRDSGCRTYKPNSESGILSN